MKREYRAIAAAALAVLLAVPGVCASAPKKKRPLNYRYRQHRRKPPAAVPAGVDASTGAAAPPAPAIRLLKGRWKPEVREAVERLIAEKGKDSPSYDPKTPPVAVLPWSDALVAGDPAELVFLKLVTEVKFHVDDSWWEIVPMGYGRQPVHAAFDQFANLPPTAWPAQPAYSAWRKGMLSSYLALCGGVGRKECRSYLARLWAGYRKEEAEVFAKRVLDEEKNKPSSVEVVPAEPGDPAPLRIRRGLRLVPEMRDLTAKLFTAGFDVWVIDDVPQPVLEVSAEDYGIDPSRVYGVRGVFEGPRLTGGVLKPVPTRGGKTEAVQASLGRPADFVLGRDIADFDLLSYGEGLRVVLDVDEDLVKKAVERAWPIQPVLTR